MSLQRVCHAFFVQLELSWLGSILSAAFRSLDLSFNLSFHSSVFTSVGLYFQGSVKCVIQLSFCSSGFVSLGIHSSGFGQSMLVVFNISWFDVISWHFLFFNFISCMGKIIPTESTFASISNVSVQYLNCTRRCCLKQSASKTKPSLSLPLQRTTKKQDKYLQLSLLCDWSRCSTCAPSTYLKATFFWFLKLELARHLAAAFLLRWGK